jgi:predicted nuclease with RNAse H fold
MTHRLSWINKMGIHDKPYSLEDLADLSGYDISILQEVYNRGIGAYETNPQSVRMKETFKKNVKAPLSKKLSKEQWAMARVYSFLDENPKHDQDLIDS